MAKIKKEKIITTKVSKSSGREPRNPRISTLRLGTLEIVRRGLSTLKTRRLDKLAPLEPEEVTKL